MKQFREPHQKRQSALRICWRCLFVFIGMIGPVKEARAQVDSLQIEASSVDGRTVSASPRGALIRSAIMPGWGQLYNRKPVKAGSHLMIQAGLFAGVMLQRNPSSEGGLTSLGNTMLLGLIGFRIFSIADAYVDAHFADFDGIADSRDGPYLIVGYRKSW
ncbi:MAG: hypothetical protein HOH43_00245 [Candidatus Latescibacteria bacterium]|nr:hypothetical protein [Candidatus Latescibacterota bacterium]